MAALTASVVGSASPKGLHCNSKGLTSEKESESDATYENVRTSATAGYKGSLPPAPGPTLANGIAAKSSPKQRRESVPFLKPASPTPQTKLPHNLHSGVRQHADITGAGQSERQPGIASINQHLII